MSIINIYFGFSVGLLSVPGLVRHRLKHALANGRCIHKYLAYSSIHNRLCTCKNCLYWSRLKPFKGEPGSLSHGRAAPHPEADACGDRALGAAALESGARAALARLPGQS